MKKREELIKFVNEGLRKCDKVIALYEGGSKAFGRDDEKSDIDYYVITENDEDFERVFEILEKLLPIEQVHIRPWPKEMLTAQKFYKLKDYPPYFLFDVALLTKEAKDKYLQPEIHGHAVVYFDKEGITKTSSFDVTSMNPQMKMNLGKALEKYNFFSCFVEKEIKRGHFAEALEIYRMIVLSPLVMKLRIKHSPFHFDWGLKAIHYDLPVEIVKQLEDLYMISGKDDFLRKLQTAKAWLAELLKE